MITDLLKHWPVDQQRSYMIGDKDSDCAAARAAGIIPLLFEQGNLRDFLENRLPSRES